MKAVYKKDIYEEFDKFDMKDAVVWVSPLEGAAEFAKGKLSAGTLLIGVAIKGVPKIGVVHNPFQSD